MEQKADYGISITTYEIDEEDNLNPTLTHIFWGNDLDRCLSHSQLRMR